MNGKHTPGPWRLQNESPTRICVDGAPVRVANVDVYPAIALILRQSCKNWRVLDTEQVANARRIVSCVNACEGIADPETAIPGLVAALETIAEEAGDAHVFNALAQSIYQTARAALAMAKGE